MFEGVCGLKHEFSVDLRAEELTTGSVPRKHLNSLMEVQRTSVSKTEQFFMRNIVENTCLID